MHQCLCGEQGALYALAMRWEEGGTLHNLLHAPGVAWGARTAERLLLCARIASGLLHLHCNPAREIIHGDLKPENILLSKRGPDALPRVSDFGLAKLREAGRVSRLSSAAVAHDKRGTWPYMAPKMYPSASASGASHDCRTGGWESHGCVRAGHSQSAERQSSLGGLCRNPARHASSAGGVPYLSLPSSSSGGSGTPEAVVQLLKSCLHAERVQRPRVDEVAERLHQAAQAMASGEFDVFLSHKWSRDGRHAPLTTQVYQALLAAGLRVWLDTAEMGFDMNVSMESGIARSGCVVALLNAPISSPTQVVRLGREAARRNLPESGESPAPGEGA